MFQPEQSRPPNILFYERSSLHPSRSVIVFIWSSFFKKSQSTKYGDQNVHFFDVTPYIIFTHPVFLCLYWHIWHAWNISFPTIYNFMGVMCTHYKLCSVQGSKLTLASSHFASEFHQTASAKLYHTHFSATRTLALIIHDSIKIQFKINMSTENVFVELFTQTRRTSLFSLMAIWGVIYFRHYIIMTYVT